MFENLALVYQVWDFITGPTGVALFAALFGVSEVLASIPQVQANSVFQAVSNALRKLAKK